MIDLTYWVELVFILIIILGLFLVLVILGWSALLIYLKFRNREDMSMNFVLLEVAVPKDNEIKIDAVEQMFASLYSMKKGGFWQKFKAQQHISLEIVGKKEDIHFYVSTHRDNMELVEKLIAGTYPGTKVKQVDEYNIFYKEAKVAFAELSLRSHSFRPIKTFKDLPVDSLSSITSALAKFGENEAAAIQIIISPADSSWSKSGEGFVAKTKTR